MLNVPLYYVHGNHVTELLDNSGQLRANPWGAINLHRHVIYNRDSNLLIAGIEGSLRYSGEKYQYSPAAMWRMVLLMAPRLLLNKVVYGRYLDIFVSHSAPLHIQDDKDYPHRGVAAFRWLISVFKACFIFMGISTSITLLPWKTQFGETLVVNSYGYREISWPVLQIPRLMLYRAVSIMG